MLTAIQEMPGTLNGAVLFLFMAVCFYGLRKGDSSSEKIYGRETQE